MGFLSKNVRYREGSELTVLCTWNDRVACSCSMANAREKTHTKMQIRPRPPPMLNHFDFFLRYALINNFISGMFSSRISLAHILHSFIFNFPLYFYSINLQSKSHKRFLVPLRASTACAYARTKNEHTKRNTNVRCTAPLQQPHIRHTLSLDCVYIYSASAEELRKIARIFLEDYIFLKSSHQAISFN